jgi:hypothetical protein
MKNLIYNSLYLFTFLLLNCKHEEPYIHNYKGEWYYFEDYNDIVFSFNDSISTYSKYINQVAYGCWLIDSKSIIQIEEVDDGVLKIIQDSCSRFDYNFGETTECDSLIAEMSYSPIEGNHIMKFTSLIMMYKVFYIKYCNEGEKMKIQFYLDIDGVRVWLDGRVYEFHKAHI